MEFDRYYLEKLVKEIAFPEIKLSYIPAIDLYIEQLISLIESKFINFMNNAVRKSFRQRFSGE